jgi:hypothetical protein
LCNCQTSQWRGATDHFDKPIAQAGALLSGRPNCGAIADQPGIRGCLPRQPIHLNSLCPDAPIDRGRHCFRRGCCKSAPYRRRLFLRSMRSSNTSRAVRFCETKALGTRVHQCNPGSAGADLLQDLITPGAHRPARNRQPMSRFVHRPSPPERLMAGLTFVRRLSRVVEYLTERPWSGERLTGQGPRNWA